MYKYQATSDRQLLGFYCKGNNEVPHFWMMKRYFSLVFLVIKRRVNSKESAEDVMGDIVVELIEVAPIKRAHKVVLKNGTAKASLLMLSKARAIDHYRKYSKLEAWDANRLQEKLDNEREDDFLRRLEGRDLQAKLLEAIEEKYGKRGREEFDAFLRFPKDNKKLAEHLGIKEAHARSVKQRLTRWTKRIFLHKNPVADE